MVLPHNTGIIQSSITLYGTTEDYVGRSILNSEIAIAVEQHSVNYWVTKYG